MWFQIDEFISKIQIITFITKCRTIIANCDRQRFARAFHGFCLTALAPVETCGDSTYIPPKLQVFSANSIQDRV